MWVSSSPSLTTLSLPALRQVGVSLTTDCPSLRLENLPENKALAWVESKTPVQDEESGRSSAPAGVLPFGLTGSNAKGVST